MKQIAFWALFSLILGGASGCIEVAYSLQATRGQVDLWSRRVPIEEILQSEDSPRRTQLILQEVERILAFANSVGLKDKGNYRQYVELDRDAVVWFMTASKPLSFEEKVWGFPVVGTFPYLGWFSYQDALAYRAKLQDEGWEVFLRRVRAYSTGGWFRDPVLSTMIEKSDDALLWLATVLFHELTHANILIANQSTFNESIASFVGDTVSSQYLEKRFGGDSELLTKFREVLVHEKQTAEKLRDAYKKMEALYDSTVAEEEKLRVKEKTMTDLRIELDLSYALNNAALIGFRTYNAGQKDIRELFLACGKNWDRFFKVVLDIDGSWFAEEQMEDISSVIARAKQVCGIGS